MLRLSPLVPPGTSGATLVQYWKQRALAAESATRFEGSLSPQQRQEAQRNMMMKKAAEDAAAEMEKSCKARGEVLVADNQTGDPSCMKPQKEHFHWSR